MSLSRQAADPAEDGSLGRRRPLIRAWCLCGALWFASGCAASVPAPPAAPPTPPPSPAAASAWLPAQADLYLRLEFSALEGLPVWAMLRGELDPRVSEVVPLGAVERVWLALRQEGKSGTLVIEGRFASGFLNAQAEGGRLQASSEAGHDGVFQPPAATSDLLWTQPREDLLVLATPDWLVEALAPRADGSVPAMRQAALMQEPGALEVFEDLVGVHLALVGDGGAAREGIRASGRRLPPGTDGLTEGLSRFVMKGRFSPGLSLRFDARMATPEAAAQRAKEAYGMVSQPALRALAFMLGIEPLLDGVRLKSRGDWVEVSLELGPGEWEGLQRRIGALSAGLPGG